MYFGQVKVQGNNTYRIHVIAKVVNSDQASFLLTESHIEEEIGSTKSVFIPYPQNYNIQNNQLLFFSTKPNPKYLQKIKDDPYYAENHDSHIMNEHFSKMAAYEMVICRSKTEQDLFQEVFDPESYCIDSPIYILMRSKVLGIFRFKKAKNGLTINIPDNINYYQEWNYRDLSVFSDVNGNRYLLEIPETEKSIKIDCSTETQLKNWLKKKIKSSTNDSIKKLFPHFETFLFSQTSDEEIEIQKWKKIQKLFKKFQWEYNEIKEFTNKPEIIEHIKGILVDFKQDFIDENIEEIEDELFQLKKEKQDKYDNLEKELREKEKELRKVELKLQKLKSTKLEFDTMLQRFESNKSLIVDDLLMIQSVFPQSHSIPQQTNPDTISRFTYTNNEFEPRQFFSNCSKEFQNREIKLNVKNILYIYTALEQFSGLVVPDQNWSRIYCSCEPSYHHIPLVVNPSWKEIADLWEMYLKNIVEVAQQTPQSTFFIHFEGVQNSLPDIWMKTIHNLISEPESIVPVPGLPRWPSNIKFFFSPSQIEEELYPISDFIMKLWPAYTLEKSGDTEEFSDFSDSRVSSLADNINNHINDDDKSLEISKRMFYQYPRIIYGK